MKKSGSDDRTIVTAKEILERLRAGVDESYEIRLRSATIQVRVLSITEMNQCRQRAKKDMGLLKGDETDYNLELQKNILSLASQVPKGDAPILSHKVLEELTIDEVNHLYNEYITIMNRVNPAVEDIEPEEFRLLVDALKKNAISPKDLSLKHLRAICSSYVDLISRPENPS